jgi:uncharacterized protein YlxW (UPF0749 family)
MTRGSGRSPIRRSSSRRSWGISIGLGLALVGFVMAAQWNSSLQRQTFSTSAQRVLTDRIVQLEQQQEDLRAQIAEEEAKVRAFQERGAGSQQVLEELNAQLAAARLAAGLTDVRGPGVVIEIADSRRVVPAGENPANYIVLVDDLQDIVTALWASGAEAIAISGGGSDDAPAERMVATTSIYGVGASILVNTAFLQPPFRIEAIGPDGLHDRFLADPAFRSGVQRRIDAFGLEFASEPANELRLPAFVGKTTLSWGVSTAQEVE